MDSGFKAIVSGVVQGVGFRWFVAGVAEKLGIIGWVRNKPDGTVEVTAEGKSDALKALIRELHIGPRSSSVTSVQLEWTKFTGKFNSFDITY